MSVYKRDRGSKKSRVMCYPSSSNPLNIKEELKIEARKEMNKLGKAKEAEEIYVDSDRALDWGEVGRVKNTITLSIKAKCKISLASESTFLCMQNPLPASYTMIFSENEGTGSKQFNCQFGMAVHCSRQPHQIDN